MIDRNNVDDMFKVVNDDFNWIVEDMTQYNSSIKEKLLQYDKEDKFDDADEQKQKYKDIKKLTEKVENLRQEYISVCKDDNDKNENTSLEQEFDDLSDWTDTNPEQILLFGEKYEIKSWRDVLLCLLEELTKKNKSFIENIDKVEEFKGRTRLYFTYDESLIDKKYYKMLPNGLYVMVNSNANSIISLCKKILVAAGYSEDELKIKVNDESKTNSIEEIQVETGLGSEIIKLPKKYASVSLNKEIFRSIIYSILNRKSEYGTNFIEPRKIEEKFDNIITNKTNYTTSYHVIINIIKYLKDFHFVDNYADTKKGKYIVIDNNSLKTWVDNNI